MIGQLLAGVVIGPTVLGSRSADLLSEDTVRVVRDLGTIGLVAFAFAIGARLDRAHLPRTHHFALVAATVFGLPFVAGIAVAFWLYGGHDVVDGTTVGRLPFVLFVGAAISITAFPVLARIIEEHGLVGTAVGSLAVSCAAVNDVLSWIALAIALFADSGSRLTRGGEARRRRRRPRARARRARRPRRPARGGTAACAAVARASRSSPRASPAAAVATSAMGLHYVFGAFAFGVLVSRARRWPRSPRAPIRSRASLGAVLLPLYLVLPGATTDFRDLDLSDGGEVLVVLVVAAGVEARSRAPSRHARTGLSRHDALSVGVLLNTRGLVELVALGIGLSAGLLDTSLYAVLVIMAVVTTIATSPSLRLLGFVRLR